MGYNSEKCTHSNGFYFFLFWFQSFFFLFFHVALQKSPNHVLLERRSIPYTRHIFEYTNSLLYSFIEANNTPPQLHF
jgi:hypothetical protein